MDIWILDHNYQSYDLIDSFRSVIWNEAYVGAGDFELIIPINDHNVELIGFIRNQRKYHLDTFASTNESDQVMIVEKVEVISSIEYGSEIMLKGRSLECILQRRIVWHQTKLDGIFQNMVLRLLNENIINPEMPERKISNFMFLPSDDPKITKLKLTKQFTGDNLYDGIIEVCNINNLGFHVSLDTKNYPEPKLVFQLYAGVDRSYDQTDNPYVVFSPNFENLIASSLLEDVTEYCTTTLVLGEDEGNQRRALVVNDQNPYLTTPGGSGMSRREHYTDARDIQSERYSDDGEVIIIPDEEYYGYLQTRGEEKLSENKLINEFEGEVEAEQMFIYGIHFYRGDIVQVETEYGVTSKMRITKMVRSQDETGSKAYPVFEILQ